MPMKRIVILNHEADPEILRNLSRYDIEPITIGPTDRLPEPLSGHADLQVFPMGDVLYCNPDISTSFVDKIGHYCEIVLCSTQLGSEPVKTIPYCVADTGAVAFHRTKYTDTDIKCALKSAEIPLMDVPQGFARCSIMIVSRHHIITADAKVHRIAQIAGIDSLLISPGNIAIRGYRYGFIGGASGVVGGTVFLTGTIDHHPDREIILQFIEKAGQSLVILSGIRAADIGSMFFIDVGLTSSLHSP